MKTTVQLKAVWGWMLAGMLCLVMAGCGGSDGGGSGESASTVVPDSSSTSSASSSTGSGSSTQGGSTSTTNSGSSSPQTAQQLMIPPNIVTPVNNQIIYVGVSEDIRFEWTPVPDATAYIFELDGVQHGGTVTWAKVNLGIGVHRCRVWAMVNGKQGPASATITFTLESLFAAP